LLSSTAIAELLPFASSQFTDTQHRARPGGALMHYGRWSIAFSAACERANVARTATADVFWKFPPNSRTRALSSGANRPRSGYLHHAGRIGMSRSSP
jgi:hypothetical protein